MSGLAAAAPLDARQRARVAIPFVIVTLIWGSTWLVIRDQIGTVPPAWSIAWRFGIAAIAMAAWALASRTPLRLTARQHGLAAFVGAFQFCGNFQFVYRAEQYITSGIVAVMFALLVIPNAILGRIVLGARVSRPFLFGSAVALVGIGLLFAHELGGVGARPGAVALGLMFTLFAVLCASVANVTQATAAARTMPMIALVAWAMIWGFLFDAVYALATMGPPVLPADPRYWAGAAWLGLAGSTLSFPLYFSVIRTIGPARAAYSSVLVPVIAMSLSTLFEGYVWTVTAASGAALVAGGLIVALAARR